MAVRTLGSNATTSLSAVSFSLAPTVLLPADLATIAQGIKDDQLGGHLTWPAAFTYDGQLFIPNRGVLKVLPGDYVAIDTTTGWPILLSARAIASGPWTHS